MNTTVSYARLRSETCPDHRAFADMAERLGATVEHRQYGVRFQADTELVELLHRVAALIGETSCIFGCNRFILFDPEPGP